MLTGERDCPTVPMPNLTQPRLASNSVLEDDFAILILLPPHPVCLEYKCTICVMLGARTPDHTSQVGTLPAQLFLQASAWSLNFGDCNWEQTVQVWHLVCKQPSHKQYCKFPMEKCFDVILQGCVVLTLLILLLSLSQIYDEIEVFPLSVYDVQLTKTGDMTDFGECREPSETSAHLTLDPSLSFFIIIYFSRMGWYVSILREMAKQFQEIPLKLVRHVKYWGQC